MSSETPMHLEVYQQLPEVRAVIHSHPVFASALTVAGMTFPADVLPETSLLLGEVPVTEYVLPASEEGRHAIRPFVREHRALLLKRHGALTYGANLDEALIHLERIEHVVEVFWRAHLFGRVERLSLAELGRLQDLRERGLRG
jgi:L-fuculose-phosphate aldolase